MRAKTHATPGKRRWRIEDATSSSRVRFVQKPRRCRLPESGRPGPVRRAGVRRSPVPFMGAVAALVVAGIAVSAGRAGEILVPIGFTGQARPLQAWSVVFQAGGTECLLSTLACEVRGLTPPSRLGLVLSVPSFQEADIAPADVFQAAFAVYDRASTPRRLDFRFWRKAFWHRARKQRPAADVLGAPLTTDFNLTSASGRTKKAAAVFDEWMRWNGLVVKGTAIAPSGGYGLLRMDFDPAGVSLPLRGFAPVVRFLFRQRVPTVPLPRDPNVPLVVYVFTERAVDLKKTEAANPNVILTHLPQRALNAHVLPSRLPAVLRSSSRRVLEVARREYPSREGRASYPWFCNRFLVNRTARVGRLAFVLAPPEPR